MLFWPSHLNQWSYIAVLPSQNCISSLFTAVNPNQGPHPTQKKCQILRVGVMVGKVREKSKGELVNSVRFLSCFPLLLSPVPSLPSPHLCWEASHWDQRKAEDIVYSKGWLRGPQKQQFAFMLRQRGRHQFPSKGHGSNDLHAKSTLDTFPCDSSRVGRIPGIAVLWVTWAYLIWRQR